MSEENNELTVEALQRIANHVAAAKAEYNKLMEASIFAICDTFSVQLMADGYEVFKEFISLNDLECSVNTGYTRDGQPFVKFETEYSGARVCVYASGDECEEIRE